MRKTVLVFIVILLVLNFSQALAPAYFDDFKPFFDSHGSMMLLLEPASGRIVYANRAALDFYGYANEDMLSMDIFSINELSKAQVQEKMTLALDERRNYFEFVHKDAWGNRKHVQVYSYPVKLNGTMYLFSIIHDVTDVVYHEQLYEAQRARFLLVLYILLFAMAGIIFILYRLNDHRKKTLKALESSRNKYKAIHEELLHHSYHDQLTGLYNRRFFETEVLRLDLPRNLPLGIIMGDLNALKLTNDAFGHEAGDDLIIAASDVLKETCRGDDIISRWGGDEFIILITQCTPDIAHRLVKRIYSQGEAQSIQGLPVSFSLGYALKESESEDMSDIIQRAERDMYKMKLDKSLHVKQDMIDRMMSVILYALPYQEQHIRGVQYFMHHLSLALNLNETHRLHLQLLSELHDVGLISVDKRVLNKKGYLTNDDWDKIKRHSEIGYRIASSHPELAEIASEILFHHENVDGTGYPKGYVGDEIPYNSRMLRICDAFEVMLSGRHYQAAKSYDDALSELKTLAGIEFDADLVKVFINLPCHDLRQYPTHP